MGIFSTLPEEYQEVVSDKELYNQLERLYFEDYENTFKYFEEDLRELEVDEFRVLSLKYHGLGHYQVFLVNLKTKEYFVSKRGGSNCYQKSENAKNILDEVEASGGCLTLRQAVKYAYMTHEKQFYCDFNEIDSKFPEENFEEWLNFEKKEEQ